MKNIITTLLILFTCIAFAGEPKYNLKNGDVRHTLIQAAQSEGWKLISAYKKIKNARNPKEGWTWVLVFENNGKVKKYEGK